MASTNPFLTLVSTIQTNSIGSTIATGFIPYISTAGRQTYSNTLSTLTVSTLSGTNVTFPIVNTSTINASSMNTPTVNTTTVNATTVNATSIGSVGTTSISANSINTNSITIGGYPQNSGSLGYGQNWASIPLLTHTTYTNSSARPIFITVRVGGPQNSSATLFMGTSYYAEPTLDVLYFYNYAINGTYGNVGNVTVSWSFIVPPGIKYRPEAYNGAGFSTPCALN